MLTVCVTNSNFKIEDNTKLDCFCYFCAFLKTRGVRTSLYFYERGCELRKVGNLTHGQDFGAKHVELVILWNARI